MHSVFCHTLYNSAHDLDGKTSPGQKAHLFRSLGSVLCQLAELALPKVLRSISFRFSQTLGQIGIERNTVLSQFLANAQVAKAG